MKDNYLFKSLFSEIICGYSFSSECKFYIKHSTPTDSFEIEEIYQDNYNIALSNGIPTNEEQIDYLAKNNLWDKNDDDKIKDKKLYIHGLRQNKSKSALSKEREFFNQEIKKIEKEIIELENKKQGLFGLTCETYASKKCSDFSMFRSLFKNNKLTELLFSLEEFDDIDDKILEKVISLYNKSLSKFNEKNVKKVAISPFFCNLFYLCDNNPYTFYGKPIISLTYYQSDLFSHGCYYKHLMSECKDKIDPAILNDPDKLVEYYESLKSVEDIQKSIQPKGEFSSQSIVGSSSEDRKKTGQDTGLDIGLALKQSGKKKFSIQDLVKLHGNM